MKNAVFTIVAKNYLSLAKALMQSVREYNNDCEMYVFVADEFTEGQVYTIEDCKILEAKNLNIPDFYEMAFKYNITEFCTAIKPFCFSYLKKEFDYQNIIYFDPDIFMFNDINRIFEELGDKLCLLTPHYFTPEVDYSGAVPEEMILWVGIFNLGFFAINMQHKNANKLVSWWENRLASSCYADKQDGLHTDQKWLDYLPSYFPDDVKISHNMGYNLSVWNLHERRVEATGSGYDVVNLIDESVAKNKLTFVHFSGYDIKNTKTIHKHHPILNTDNRPEMAPLLNLYRDRLTQSGYFEIIKWAYTYNMFDNGFPIILFQRRLFRRLLQLGQKFSNPFAVTSGSFYDILNRNGITVKENVVDKQTATALPAYQGKIKLILKSMKLMNKVLGLNKYSMLLKFLTRYARPENQLFLMDDWIEKHQFYNENVRNK